MCRKLIHYFLFIWLVFLYSCEYELENTNYVELKKKEDPVINLSLNAPQNEKGEYLVHYRHVKYNFEIPEEYPKYQIYFTSETVNSVWRDNDYLVFNYYYDAKPSFSIKCEVLLLPDTLKSIAEICGYEYYKKTVEWNIVFDPQPVPQLHIQCEKKEDKIYRLTWEEPDPYYGKVDYYEVAGYSSYFGQDFQVKTNELFYDIGPLSDGDYFHYKVSACFEGNYPESLYGGGSINTY
jgi:hypothetical protein